MSVGSARRPHDGAKTDDDLGRSARGGVDGSVRGGGRAATGKSSLAEVHDLHNNRRSGGHRSGPLTQRQSKRGA